jgi:hypothetical protein
MLFVSPEYFEGLRRHDDDDINMETRNERRHMRSLLKKYHKEYHPYDSWIKIRQVQDPLLRCDRKKRRPLPLPIYDIQATGSTHVDFGIQTYESYRAADCNKGSGFVGDYVMSEDEEIARFGETHFGRIASHST